MSSTHFFRRPQSVKRRGIDSHRSVFAKLVNDGLRLAGGRNFAASAGSTNSASALHEMFKSCGLYIVTQTYIDERNTGRKGHGYERAMKG